jgi:hypothetical protein
MDRFIRFYQEAFDATVVHDNRHHGGHVGERMVILAIGGQSAFKTSMFGCGRSTILGSMPGAERPSSTCVPGLCT